MKTIIIGSNAAGMSFAAKYKRNNPTHDVIAFEKRDYVSFGGCGLPYFAGNFFESTDTMIARSVDQTIASGIDLRVNAEVNDVDFKAKKISYQSNGKMKSESYDQLIISLGANPIVPNFGEYNKDAVTPLVSKADGIKLRSLLNDEQKQNVAIIGGGFIGLEVMDSAHHLGKNVTLIEREEHIMSRQFSSEMIEQVESEIKESGINLMTNTAVEAIKDSVNGYEVMTNNGTINADIIVMAIGFKPNTDFINLDKIANGAILVDQYSRTSEKDVYAVGDCATIYDQVQQKQVYLPLATSANKQGRMVADYLSNKPIYFKGMLASSCLKVLDFELACTGMNEQTAIKNQVEYKTIKISDKNQTDYYPGQVSVDVKLVYRKTDNVLLGAEMIGKKGVVGRIDALAVAIQSGITTNELGYIDFCYAPPFARTWDILNVAGNVAK